MKINLSIFLTLILAGCSLAPGIHINPKKQEGKDFVYIESLDKNVYIKNISTNLSSNININSPYRIGSGDQIAITVWGLPDVFPIRNINPDQNLRRVDSNGKIFFPYVGSTEARGKTQNELRNDLTESLSNYFNDPQIDVSIARFNSQKVYLLGEVSTPLKINITDIPLTLSDAIGEVKGLNTTTSNPKEVYIIRQNDITETPEIYIADMTTPSGIIDAGRFYLKDKDLIYVNAKGTTRWNRVVAQFFPFSTFLNSVDRLIQSD